MKELLQTVFDAITQHIPSDAVWMPYVGIGLTGLFALVLLLKGARLAPLMAAFAFLGLGGICGSFLASWISTPVWPTIAVVGVLGFIIGLVLFKFWMAVLVAGCFILVSMSLYTSKVLVEPLQHFTADNYDAQNGLVTLPEPGAVALEDMSPSAQLGQLWTYLGDNVSSFQTSFFAIVISTGLAGLVFGLLLPRISRALWAATAGTFLLMLAATMLLEAVAPRALAWLGSLGGWGWLIVIAVWGGSMAYNLLDTRDKRPATGEGDDAEAEPATS
ncbi:MAG: hypothetical protein KKB50_01675 [Planctomycetes bacterium]|nr:hypothetical protein [Planctomycetota bacterium]